MPGRRILVTGASGFIGRAIVDTLLACESVHVIATSRGAGEGLTKAESFNGRLTVLGGVDLANAGAVARIPHGLTHVVHTAALARFEGASRGDLDVHNVQATGNLLTHLRDTSGMTLRRVLFTSSIGVHDRPRFYDSRVPIREDSPLAPVSEYGASKLRAERLVEQSGLPYVIARLAWIYGPQMRPASHVRTLASMCQKGSPVARLHLPGRVSVGYIDDVARALGDLLFKDRLAYSTYLVAHPEPVSFGEIFAVFGRLLGKPAPVALPAWSVRPLRTVATLAPMKLRVLVEDYYVCSVAHMEGEGIRLSVDFPDGARRSVEQGRWFDAR